MPRNQLNHFQGFHAVMAVSQVHTQPFYLPTNTAKQETEDNARLLVTQAHTGGWGLSMHSASHRQRQRVHQQPALRMPQRGLSLLVLFDICFYYPQRLRVRKVLLKKRIWYKNKKSLKSKYIHGVVFYSLNFCYSWILRFTTCPGANKGMVSLDISYRSDARYSLAVSNEIQTKVYGVSTLFMLQIVE